MRCETRAKQFNMASPGLRDLCFKYFMFSWIMLAKMEVNESSSSVQEYCRGEPFEANCGSDGVILMTSATHGRMELGRCITWDKQLGCEEDALLQMDSFCSGRHSCNKDRITFNLDFPSCIGEHSSYLEAGYECLTVLLPGKDNCRITNKKNALLANSVTETHQCGSTTSPWVLEAHSSQKINLTLMDMGLYPTQKGKQDAATECIKYGSIREVSYGREHVICGGVDRMKHLMMSEGNKLEINMLPPSQIGDVYFLLQFDVLGCEDIKLPSDMWLKRGSGHVIVGCYSSRDTWKLDCVEDKWQGTIGNCTKAISTTPLLKKAEIPTPEQEIDMVAFSNEIGIAAAVVSSVFLSILLLVIGLLYDRRRTTQMEREIIQVHVADEFSWNASNKKPIPQENGNTNTACQDGNPPGGNTENYQRTSDWCQGQRPPSHVDHIYDTPSYFDLDPDYMKQSINGQFHTMGNRDSYLQPTDDSSKQLVHLNTIGSHGNRDSYLQPAEGLTNNTQRDESYSHA